MRFEVVAAITLVGNGMLCSVVQIVERFVGTYCPILKEGEEC